MAVFPGTPSEPGCIGALAMGPTYKPSMDGARVYFHTEDIDKTLQIVVNSGGKIEYPKTSIGELGSVAESLIPKETESLCIRRKRNDSLIIANQRHCSALLS